MDVEDPRQFKLSKRELTDVIKAFCDALIKAGYYAGLYIQGSA
jgi:Holliday junction resolvase RusA-like endonuclease